MMVNFPRVRSDAVAAPISVVGSEWLPNDDELDTIIGLREALLALRA